MVTHFFGHHYLNLMSTEKKYSALVKFASKNYPFLALECEQLPVEIETQYAQNTIILDHLMRSAGLD